MIPHQELAGYILALYGHETAHLDRDEQIGIALDLARRFNNTAAELLTERDEEKSALLPA